MIDMKRTKAEVEKDSEPMEVSQEEYPYGLCIDLDQTSLEKLGKSVTDFQVGDELLIQCKVKVKGVRSSQYADGEDHESVDLQITEMVFGDDKGGKEKGMLSRMYGGSGGND